MTSNVLITKTFQSHAVRIVTIDGDPWFVAIDVARALGLSTPHMAYKRLSADQITYRSQTAVGLPGGRDIALVSESGLYALVLRSDKPDAKPFQDWVTRDVLPSIRKTGGYLLNEEARETAKADDRQAMPLPEQFVLRAISRGVQGRNF